MSNSCKVQCQNKDCKKVFDEYEHVVCPHCGMCPKCSFFHTKEKK